MGRMNEARRARLERKKEGRKRMLAGLKQRWAKRHITCVLCGEEGLLGKMVRKPDINVCKPCWDSLTQSRKAAIAEAIDRI